jgi:hypothetical protein
MIDYVKNSALKQKLVGAVISTSVSKVLLCPKRLTVETQNLASLPNYGRGKARPIFYSYEFEVLYFQGVMKTFFS